MLRLVSFVCVEASLRHSGIVTSWTGLGIGIGKLASVMTAELIGAKVGVRVRDRPAVRVGSAQALSVTLTSGLGPEATSRLGQCFEILASSLQG